MKKFFTADGKLIKPGMIIFVKPPEFNSFISHCEKVEKITQKGPISAYGATLFENGLIIPSLVYSSEEAASKAAGKPTMNEVIKKAQDEYMKNYKRIYDIMEKRLPKFLKKASSLKKKKVKK